MTESGLEKGKIHRAFSSFDWKFPSMGSDVIGTIFFNEELLELHDHVPYSVLLLNILI